MKANKSIATYKRLRNQPLWRLLAADNGPVIIALLQAHLMEKNQSLPAALFYERIGRDLEELRASEEDLPQTAQAYISKWLTDGFLVRRFPAGASEEVYELSTAAEGAIRFVKNLIKPQKTATESRLSGVIHQLVKLAEETSTDSRSRIKALKVEQKRINAEIKAVSEGKVQPLADERALERIREIIALAEGLVSDFRRVRDEFEQLNRELRQHLLDTDGNRGDVLEALFSGVDLIANSEPGRTFSAFWSLLVEPEQNTTLEDALDTVLSRKFAAQLDLQERRFLLRVTRTLLDQGGIVHDVAGSLARGLRQFVQSREYQEQRRLTQVLKKAQYLALGLKESVKVTNELDFTLQLTGSRISSLSRWALRDPSLHKVTLGMKKAEPALIDVDAISQLLLQSEIQLSVLKTNINVLLQERSQVSIGEVLQQFPAEQGLGSIIGYISLGSRYGVRVDETEMITWQGADKQYRQACIPMFYFLKEKANELA